MVTITVPTGGNSWPTLGYTNGAGDDIVNGSNVDDPTLGGETLQGYRGSDEIYGYAGDDKLYGDTKSSGSISTTDAGDYLYGGAGDDSLFGQAGDDFLDGGTGTNSIDGGTGVDTVDYKNSTAAVTVDLSNGSASAGAYATDTLTDVENVTASDYGDSLTGDSQANRFYGRGGDDTIDGGTGNDTAVYQGDLSQYTVTKTANGGVTITDDRTQAEIDAANGGSGVSEGTDTVSNVEFYEFNGTTYTQSEILPKVNNPATGTVTISGTAREDEKLTANTAISDADGLGSYYYQWLRDGIEITGETSGVMFLRQVDVGSVITVRVSFTDGAGFDEAVTSDGTDPVENVNDAPTGQPVITGNAYVGDTLTADASAIADEDGLGAFNYQWLRDGVAISGATSATYDVVKVDLGAAITVLVSYKDAWDTVETLTSDPTKKVVYGDLNKTGTPNADKLIGYGGNDTLDGLGGNDVINGKGGSDTLYGRGGKDKINGGNGKDYVEGGAGKDTIWGGSSRDKLYGEDSADKIYGGSGNDLLDGGDGDDVLNGGDGKDKLLGGEDDDYLEGKAGNDTLIGGDGEDELYGNGENDKLKGGSDDDILYGGTGMDTLLGGADDDMLYGGEGDDTLKGNQGKDELRGGFGDDTLLGANGRDYMFGGDGDDTLTGGKARDTFVFTANHDVITDFETGVDKLSVASWLGTFSDEDDVLDLATQQGSDVFIDFGSGHTLTLLNVSDINDLSGSIDFI